MIGEAENDAIQDGYGKILIDFKHFQELEVWDGDFKREKLQPTQFRYLDRFDFGYVITCHKSQGSEFDNILVYNQPIGRGIERQRWLYTAITRAKKRCVLVQPEGK
jgi:exodeoxyribonuclease-5